MNRHCYDRQCRCEDCVNYELRLVKMADVDKMLDGLEAMARKQRQEKRAAERKLVPSVRNGCLAVTVIATAKLAS